jgi:choline-sulfatase
MSHIKKYIILLAFAAILPVLLLTGINCGREKKIQVILISIDTLRADHLNSYGYSRETSPHLSALAEESAYYTQAYTNGCWTMPSHMSLLTGTLPSRHGVNENIGLFGKNRYPRLHDSIQTISEILKSLHRGVVTVKFAKLSDRLGFKRGFTINHNVDPFSREDKFAQLIKALEDHKEEDFFLFIHTWMVHAPYTHSYFIPDGKLSREDRDFIDRFRTLPRQKIKEMMGNDKNRKGGDFPYFLKKRGLFNVEDCQALYDGGIRSVDRYVGRIVDRLKELGIYRRSMIIVVSDHGEHFEEHHRHMFYDHHGHDYYEEFIKVPVIIKYPHGKLKGERADQPVSLIDILPTILDYYHLKTPVPVQGESLLTPYSKRKRSYLISEAVTDPGVEKKMIRVGDLKYIVTMKNPNKPGRVNWDNIIDRKLFNLKSDPGEQHNLYKDSKFRNLCLRLEKMLKRQVRNSLAAYGPAQNTRIDKETLEHMKALGYL